MQQLKRKAEDAYKEIKKSPQFSEELKKNIEEIDTIEKDNETLKESMPQRSRPLDIKNW